MELIRSNIKVIDAVNGIATKKYHPVIDTGRMLAYLDVSRMGSGTLQYTLFNRETRQPIESWEVRYGNYHTMWQALYEPLPKYKFETILHPVLPVEPPAQDDGSIILSYYQ